MEYRTVATKLPTDEFTMFKAHCEKKGVSLAHLLRKLILREMKITVPHTVAGRNRIDYSKNRDSFTWSIELDTGQTVEVLSNVSPDFIENLLDALKLSLGERHTFIQKKNTESAPVPSEIFRR